MNIRAPLFFTLPHRVNLKRWNSRLMSSGLMLKGKDLRDVREGIVLDSFEDDILRENTILVQTGETLTLIPHNADLIIADCPPGGFRFPAALAEGPMRTLLEELAPLRAMLPKGEVDLTTDTLRLLDDEKKTCCRVDYVTLKNGSGTWSWLKTRPMRGDDDSHLLLAELLSEMTADNAAPADALNLPLSGYVAKPEIRLNPDDPAKKSLCTIVSTFIGVARENEDGVIADYDTEFLHDYRVSLRKVRSVLSLFKGVFDKETHARLKTGFKDIMKDTNLLRDRDVYLLAKPDYFALVPPRTREGLDVLFDLLEKERRRAHKSVCKALRSKAYKKQIKSLSVLFAAPENFPSGPKAKEASRAFASFLILKRYKKVCRLAGRITKTTPDEAIHDLRIQCKKLRYLIEVTTSLFHAKEAKKLLKKLKRMQEHLGSFNDQSVQQKALAECLEKYGSKDKKGILLAESIGALTSILYRKQLEERRLIIDNLTQFYSPETLSDFNRIFA
jgi:CHAD domain-containing protein